MKLLIATGLYPPDIGGPATYTTFLERHLPQRGINLSVVSFSSVRSYPKILRHFLYILRLFKMSKSADIIYALDTVSVGVPALMVSILVRKPLYLRVPGDYAWEQGQQRFGITQTLDEYLKNKKQPLAVRFLAWLQYRVAKHAVRIIVPSEYMRGVVTSWGILPEKIVRIYSAFKTIEVSESKSELRKLFGYEGFVIVTAARLVPWKGVLALIEATAQLREKGIPASLQIIGDGTSRKQLEMEVQRLGVASYVHFHGVLDKVTLAQHVRASDVFILNTSYEGLSHQLLEVMDIGAPIITTPVGGNVELIEDGKEGLLVPFNDTHEIVKALTNIHNDLELVKRLVQKAHDRVIQFREKVLIEELIKILP